MRIVTGAVAAPHQADRRLSFLNPLPTALVTGRAHDKQFAPHFGILLVRARMSSAIWCDPMTHLCLGIDDLLPVFGSVGHFTILTYECDNNLP